MNKNGLKDKHLFKEAGLKTIGKTSFYSSSNLKGVNNMQA